MTNQQGTPSPNAGQPPDSHQGQPLAHHQAQPPSPQWHQASSNRTQPPVFAPAVTPAQSSSPSQTPATSAKKARLGFYLILLGVLAVVAGIVLFNTHELPPEIGGIAAGIGAFLLIIAAFLQYLGKQLEFIIHSITRKDKITAGVLSLTTIILLIFIVVHPSFPNLCIITCPTNPKAAVPSTTSRITATTTSTAKPKQPIGTVTEFPLIPTANAGADAITLGPDGNLWFVEDNTAIVGRMTPQGVISEFPFAKGSNPAVIVAGSDHNLWVLENGSNKPQPVRLRLRKDQITTCGYLRMEAPKSQR